MGHATKLSENFKPQHMINLIDIHELKHLLERNFLWAKKGFGQHFLVDKSTLDQIINESSLTKKDTVIEVGPGPGVLTQQLCQYAGKVISIEHDRTILPALREATEEFKNLEVVQQDALKYPPPSDPQKPYKFIANLPYNVATPLLRQFLTAPQKPDKIVVLTQLEVAEKICASEDQQNPGNSNMNVLALGIQVFGKPRIAKKVPPQAFYPPPKVDSAVLVIDPYEKPRIDSSVQELFFRIIHAAFHQKRKQLAGTLAKFLQKEKSSLEAMLTKINIRPDIRPEKLSISDWEKLIEEVRA